MNVINDMKNKIPGFLGFRQVLILLLLSLFVWQSGCSSTSRTAKGRHGQVPCPCEKNSRRR